MSRITVAHSIRKDEITRPDAILVVELAVVPLRTGSLLKFSPDTRLVLIVIHSSFMKPDYASTMLDTAPILLMRLNFESREGPGL